MSLRALRRLLGAYLVVLFVLALVVRSWAALAAPSSPIEVESWWKDGKRIARYVHAGGAVAPHGAPPAGATSVREVVAGVAPVSLHPLVFPFWLVPGKDGVSVSIGDRTAYATVDDLLSVQAYDRAFASVETGIGWGVHRGAVLAVLSEQLGVAPPEMLARGTFRRLRFDRRAPAAAPVPAPGDPRPLRAWPEPITEQTLSREIVLDAVAEAAHHLARNVEADGSYRYLIDAATNRRIAGYNWPRHSGATFFLAQAAAVLDDPFVRYATLRAAARLRDERIKPCGRERCVAADDALADVGSSALALIAFTEIVRTGADGSYRPAIVDLAAFLRSQQRADGELMHLFDRQQGKPIDVQLLYYTGEASLALARAHAITGDPRDLEAARRALGRLSGEGWSFFGSRYHYSEEHWTCQAVAELWERAPDPAALDFCARWHGYQRRLQLDAGETPFDADGSFGFGPLLPPRLTPAASRGEAAGALVDVLRRERQAGRVDRADELEDVERELRRALAFVLRHQFHPGPTHLFADPAAVRGAVPGSAVDWLLRIDYAQHAGSMMIRWLELTPTSTP